MDRDRIDDLCTATTEAATNAVKHGSGGEATVWAIGDSVTVQIADNGAGIAPAHLARATLEQGFSTRVSLAWGFILCCNPPTRWRCARMFTARLCFCKCPTNPAPRFRNRSWPATRGSSNPSLWPLNPNP